MTGNILGGMSKFSMINYFGVELEPADYFVTLAIIRNAGFE
jgi:hypothetical protein